MTLVAAIVGLGALSGIARSVGTLWWCYRVLTWKPKGLS